MTDKYQEDQPESSNHLERKSPLDSLSANKKKRGIFGILILCLIAFLLLIFFQGDEKSKDLLDKEALEFEPVVKRPLILPKTPPDPIKEHKEDDSLKEARLRSAILIFGSQNKQNNSTSQSNESKTDPQDPNRQFQRDLESESVQTVKANSLGDLNYKILQGKLIDAALETAISSDLPGMVRAIVNHDVYAETGNHVLIPKGSRLLGQYSSQIRKGQTRVFVIWQRLIRTDGVEIMINSGSSDSLGRAGLDGKVNNHFWKIFGNSILLSMIGASASQSAGSSELTSTYQESLSNSFQETASQVLSGNLNIPPTINVKQGKLIKVFVAKDLDFSQEQSKQNNYSSWIITP